MRTLTSHPLYMFYNLSPTLTWQFGVKLLFNIRIQSIIELTTFQRILSQVPKQLAQ
jgi:hypothetical protein